MGDISAGETYISLTATENEVSQPCNKKDTDNSKATFPHKWTGPQMDFP